MFISSQEAITQYKTDYIYKMMLTCPAKASYCASDKHNVQVHYVCHDLAGKDTPPLQQQGFILNVQPK